MSRRAQFFSVVVVTTAMLATSPHATAATHGNCSPAAQRAATCVGWIGAPGTNPLADAVASELSAGHVDRAHRFFDANAQYMRPVLRHRVSAALRTDASTGYASIDPMAAQDSNGDCCATGAYNWLLNGQEINYYPFGYCAGGKCYTLGVQGVEMRSSVYSYPEVHYYHYLYYGSGDRPSVTNMSVVMKRDITSSPDTQVNTYSCPGGTIPLACPDENRNGPTKVGNYYYVQTNWTNTVSGYPSDSAQFQTRRWKVLTSSAADYPAYFNGG